MKPGQAITRTDLQNLVLSESSQTQKITSCRIPFIGNIQNRKIHRDRKQSFVARACLTGREVSFQGDEKCFGTRQRKWWYNNVNVLNTSDLYTVKWLKLYILCYVYPITVKQKWACILCAFVFFLWFYQVERKKSQLSLKRQEDPSERLSAAEAVNHEAPPTSLVIGSPEARRGLRDREFGNVPPAWLHRHLI